MPFWEFKPCMLHHCYPRLHWSLMDLAFVIREDREAGRQFCVVASCSGLADIGQGVISVAGLIPLVGNAADGLNAAISAARGNYGDAALDAASAIPGAGQVAGIGNIGVKFSRGGTKIFTTIKGAFGAVAKFSDPNTIRFTQDSVGVTFKDGRSVRSLIDGLKSGKISPDDLPAIRTFEKDGITYTLDNRRLFAAQQAGVQIKTIPATAAELAKELPTKFSTPNEGTIIGIRGTLD